MLTKIKIKKSFTFIFDIFSKSASLLRLSHKPSVPSTIKSPSANSNELIDAECGLSFSQFSSVVRIGNIAT